MKIMILLFVLLNTVFLSANEANMLIQEINETKEVVQEANTTVEDVNKSSIVDVNSSLNKVDENMNINIQMILENNINYKHKNRSVRYKDIEFLYDIVIGGDYKFKSSRCYSNSPEYNVTGITVNYSFSWFNDDSIVFDNNLNNTSKAKGNVDQFKLLAVEEVLGLNKDNNINYKQRIKKIYEEVGYDDWNSDRIQFTVLVDHLNKSSAVVNSIGVMVFPSYKKYIPGNINLVNRYALYFALGSATSFDSAIEFEGMVYSGGLNIEIQKGFGLHAGYSLYSVKTQDSDYKQRESLVVGVTLSSKLWKNLFSLK